MVSVGYEYCVLWGELDGTIDRRWGTYEEAKGRVSEQFGDKVIRRIKAVHIPAGDWEVIE